MEITWPFVVVFAFIGACSVGVWYYERQAQRHRQAREELEAQILAMRRDF